MCDTVVALGNVTADGSVMFAKNSDREPNEAQWLLYLPPADHPSDGTVACTYVEIPQVAHTYGVVLSKPFWMWGGEMGINEHGVTIGNEAVWTKESYEKTGLLGMDLIRLALERAANAGEALDVITELLARYGQGGDGGYTRKLFYHNAFLIADPREAWVLETAGRYWAALKVRDYYAISNGLTIGDEWDRASSGLVEHAVEKGWCRSASDFDFARCYSDTIYTRFSRCKLRRSRTRNLLGAEAGAIALETLTSLLRDHGPEAEADPDWSPAQGSSGNVCMHAGFGPVRAIQTTNSFIAHLDPRLFTILSTGTSSPCTSLFKPFWPEAMPSLGPEPGGTYDPSTLWWQHERLHRAVLKDYSRRLALYAEERDDLERELLGEAAKYVGQVMNQPADVRRRGLQRFSAESVRLARESTAVWARKVETAPLGWRWPSLYRFAWARYNRRAKMP
ncbi:MAG: C69 family dipeptidase [Anaerolineae bacterium]